MKKEIKILVADDNPKIRQTLTTMLTDEGYLVDNVKNGYEVLSYLKKKSADILILDLMMPEKDGTQILSSIKSLAPDTKVIIHTAFQKYENSVYAMIADKFVVKGTSPEDLLRIIWSMT